MASFSSIPRATAQRVPVYNHYLKSLQEKGIKRTNSKEISAGVKYDPATVRRDFSFFGELGKRGYGYDVDSLVTFFSGKLEDQKVNKIALIGAGNIGSALVRNNFSSADNLDIVVAFDININNGNKKIINENGTEVSVFDISEFQKISREYGAQIAIITVPEQFAQEIANQVVKAGYKGILNFTAVHLTLPKTVRVKDVDLTREAQTLVYFVNNQDKIKSI
ncbi:MAG: redox-sensing transcriptional repressor Rex [Lactobacillaceae bacterium]|jgi:redox-sensing transcriptional repressor|nr:redox-sensing transcriptional repressor Rex [Lactobacillaceae bacterium]